MHVALVADTWWLGAELASYRALAAGLAARGVAVTQVWPEDAPEDWLAAGASRVTWRPSTWGRAREQRLAGLAEALRRLGVDLVHALDGEVWAGAAKLAERLGAPLLLACNQAADLPRTDRYRESMSRGVAAFAAGTPALAEALGTHLGTPVAYVPPGVVVPPIQPGAVQAGGGDAERSILIRGDGSCDRHTLSLFEAIKQVSGAEHARVQCFYDGQGTDLHALWQAARRMELLAHLSLVPPRMVGRGVLQSVDLLIEPQAPGAVRVMTLAAMAHGVPVLAQRDPWLDYLRHQETAVVLETPDAAAWGTWLRRFLGDPGYFQTLAGRARLWVAAQHDMESHVAQLVGLYKRLAGEAIPFPGR